ncbi:MAG: DUF2249 domain-containing protein [Rhodospirillales bacterium]|nr:DUF2249 domain-containing protein [Rhodospirillales bacterium]
MGASGAGGRLPYHPRRTGDRRGAANLEQRDGVHIDVRGLAAPGPLVAILRPIDRVSCGDTVIVHHHREPSFLFPELAERGWSATRLPGQPDEFVYRLFRSATT